MMFRLIIGLFLVCAIGGVASADNGLSDQEKVLIKAFEQEMRKGKKASEQKLRALDERLRDIRAAKSRAWKKEEAKLKSEWKSHNKHWIEAIDPMVKLFPKITGTIQIVQAGPAREGDILRATDIIRPISSLTVRGATKENANIKERKAKLFGVDQSAEKKICNPKAFMIDFIQWQRAFQKNNFSYTCEKLARSSYAGLEVKNGFPHYMALENKYCMGRVDGTVSCLNPKGHDVVALMAAAGIVRLNAEGRAIYKKYEDFAKSRKLGYWAENAVLK